MRLGLLAAAFAAFVTAAPAAAESMIMQSAADGSYVTESTVRGTGAVLATTSQRAQAVAFEVIRLDSNRVALRHARSGQFLRAGVTQQTLLSFASPHIRGWETFEMIPVQRGHALRSVQNGLYVTVARTGQLAATARRAGPQEAFNFVPARHPGPVLRPPAQQQRPPAAVQERFDDFAGTYQITRLWGAHDGRAVDLPRDAIRNSRVTISGDGAISITVGCNSINARLNRSGASLTSGPAMGTKRGCPPLESRMENAIFEVLRNVRHYAAETRGELVFLNNRTRELWTLRRVR